MVVSWHYIIIFFLCVSYYLTVLTFWSSLIHLASEGQVLTLERQQKENERKIAAGKMKWNSRRKEKDTSNRKRKKKKIKKSKSWLNWGWVLMSWVSNRLRDLDNCCSGSSVWSSVCPLGWTRSCVSWQSREEPAGENERKDKRWLVDQVMFCKTRKEMPCGFLHDSRLISHLPFRSPSLAWTVDAGCENTGWSSSSCQEREIRFSISYKL